MYNKTSNLFFVHGKSVCVHDWTMLWPIFWLSTVFMYLQYIMYDHLNRSMFKYDVCHIPKNNFVS